MKNLKFVIFFAACILHSFVMIKGSTLVFNRKLTSSNNDNLIAIKFSNGKLHYTNILKVSALRKILSPHADCIYQTSDNGTGEWYYDASDKESPDNSGTVIVTDNGKRFKRIYNDVVDVKWFGVTGDGSDETDKLQNAVNNSQNKTLRFDKTKTYVLGGGRDHHIIIKSGNITFDGNGCNIMPFNTGGGEVFFIFDINASISNPIDIRNVVFKNFNYDAKYGTTMFIKNEYKPFFQINNLSIINNHFRNFSGFLSIGVIRIVGGNIIKADSSSRLCKNILIQNNSFLNFGKFLGLVVNKDYPIGAKSIEIKTNDSSFSLKHRVVIGGYFRIASAEEKLSPPDIYTESNSIYKVTAYDSISPNKVLITVTSGSYTNASGYDPDIINKGLLSRVKKNASILPILRWDNPTLSFCPQFNFTPGSVIATRSVFNSDENNRAKNMYLGAEFYIGGLLGKTYKIIAINKETGAISLNSPFSSEKTIQNSKTVILVGGMGNMVYIGGNEQVTVCHNRMVGGERGINGFPPTMLQTDLSNNNSSLRLTGNYMKGLYMPVELIGGTALLETSLNFKMVKGENFFTVDSSSNLSYLSKDINGDGIPENLLVKKGLPLDEVDYRNCLVEGDILSFLGMRGIYLITKIPKNYSSNNRIMISRYQPENNVQLEGGFLNSYSGNGRVTAIENPVLKIGIQWNHLVIDHNFIEDAYGETLSIGGFDTKVSNNTLNGTQRLSVEISSIYATIVNNIITNTRWAGDINRIGVSGGYGIDIRGPLSNSTSNLYFANNTVNTLDANSGMYAGQNSYTYMAINPGKQIFENNVFNGIGGSFLKPQESKVINGINYPIKSYYQLISIKHNTFNINLSGNRDNFMCLIADTTRIEDNTFNFIGNNKFQYNKILSTEQPNPLMFPDSNSFKIIIGGNKFINSTSDLSNAKFWGSTHAIINQSK